MKYIYSFTLILLSFVNALPSEHDLAQRDCISFQNPLTNLTGCCDSLTSELFWIDITLKLGVCCPLGQTLDGFTCGSPPSNNSGIYTGLPVCPNKIGSDIGIKYGHCYVLLSLNDNYLGHNSDTKYVVNGENPGVVFRICGDTSDCLASANDYVSANGTWYMQDQFGDPSGTGFAWLGGSGDLSIQNSSSSALVLGGSSTWYGGQCAICIGFPPGGAHAPCPLPPGQSHLGIANNPNSCQPFYFQEVPCRSEK